LAVPVSERDHILGPPNAPLELVEYGDFECPHCREARGGVKDLQLQLGRQMRFVYRHFPLGTIHPRAERAAEASEVAATRGRFWEMHHLLFEYQHALEDADLVRYASAVGIDPGHFVSELRHAVHALRVREDFMSGVRSGVNGTPTFFVNGVRHDGSYRLESLWQSIEEAVPVLAR
jgi:protein-disulfide isomerase